MVLHIRGFTQIIACNQYHMALPIGIFHWNVTILEYYEILRIIINVSVSPSSQGSFRKAKIVNY